MEAPQDADEEVGHLRRCINDLVSFVALPAMWSGGGPTQIVHTLLDAILDMLSLDFVYARLEGLDRHTPIELVRVAQWREAMPRSQEICAVISGLLGDEPQRYPALVRNPIGERDISIVPLRLGLQGEFGVIVAGSQRADFPRQTERLLLGVAANQAWIGLQEARLLGEQKRAASELDRRVGERTMELSKANEELRKAQAELAHVTRVMTLGELTASIAHEVNQPLVGVLANAGASLRFLSGDSPNLLEAKEAIRAIIRDGNRAADVISRMRALFKKALPTKERLNINEAIEEVVILAQGEGRRNQVALRMDLAANLPSVMADRVQIQQVVMNLILNGIEAASVVEDHERYLVITTQLIREDQVQVSVRDSGTGIDPGYVERIFDAFHTTKPGGMGMGLSISRSIIESHGGRLWATPNDGPGTTFQFTL
ncbi:MAG: GHKL domain-containing protein [Verrucomicrobia bacterium]|nr:GHKL domain-containing protein [Verrucomicrobiota bacterium]